MTKSKIRSIPRAIKSEAIIIFELLAWFITFIRADWDNEPWIKSGFNSIIWSYICSSNAFFSTNIKHLL